MLDLKPQGLALFLDIPGNYPTLNWRRKVTKFCAYLDEHHPGWSDGIDSTMPSEILGCTQYWHDLKSHLFKQGLKFHIGDTKTYWMIHQQAADRGEHGHHELIELSYVTLFGDTFTGHATEYFNPIRTDEVQTAFLVRHAYQRLTEPVAPDLNVVEHAITDLVNPYLVMVN